MPSPLEILTIGHITRDIQQDGSFVLGGTATFAALTAQRLGLSTGIVTSADPQLVNVLPTYLPNIAVHVHPSDQTTTFLNIYTDGFRTQYLHARSASLQAEDIPLAWLNTPVVLLGPLAQELTPEIVQVFSQHTDNVVAATPQGWLRRWDTDGRVWPIPWRDAEQILPLLDVLILSYDDLLPFADGNRRETEKILKDWSNRLPLLVATDGRHGATLFRHSKTTHFPAYTTHEVDPTGAGDVFAAAFLSHYYRHKNAEAAVDFANCAASFSIEEQGTRGIPTLAMIERRLQRSQ